MKTPWKWAAGAIGLLSATLLAAAAPAAEPAQARNVVLVHGAWADGSSWAEVIPRLQAAGLHVSAVQNPLTSLADFVAATRRALALQDGFTNLSEDAFLRYFANGVAHEKAEVLYAVQEPTAASLSAPTLRRPRQVAAGCGRHGSARGPGPSGAGRRE